MALARKRKTLLSKTFRRAVVVAFAALAVGGASTPVTVSAMADERPPEHSETQIAAADPVPGIAPPGADETAVYLDSAGQVIPMARGASGVSESARLGCTPVSGRDNPHRSGTGVAASGHGWWDKGNCDNDRANVFN